MKNVKLVILVSLIFMYSCEGLFNAAPTVTYSETNLNASFLEEGSSPAPSVNWNGTQGSFSITPEIEALSINSTNGIVSWTTLLAPGMHEFSVIASNNSGQISIPMTIDNAFQGVFTGTYNGSSYFQLEFESDGTVLVEANSSTNPTTGTGTWTLDENTVTALYNYEETDEDYAVRGTLTQTANEAEITGDWYFGHDPGTSPSGSVEVVLQN